ncbi:MAG: NifB/NifX family molybdenum-iron cluster-binding protein [Candidatus Omnitrophica bacterium]|nr:NifB/NifX family molybdenum-iron cluster-binding protein [Candidatus Omnitrophota bacterium]
MKVAISTEGDIVSAHFGRCPGFTIAEIENQQILSRTIIENPGHHPGFLPKFLQEKGVTVIVAGGMGMRAQELFAQAGIQTIMGISGKVDSVIEKVISGTLEGGESLCNPGAGKGYGVEKTACDHPNEDNCEHE